MTSSTVSAIARRVDAVASGMGMAAARGDERTLFDGRKPVVAGRGRLRPRAGRPGRPGRPLRRYLVSRCRWAASDAPQQSATGTQLASWGAGEYHHLGEPGQSALDWKGNMVSAHAGLDLRVGPDILAGVAGSYSSGSFRLHRQDRRQPRDGHLRRNHGQRASIHGVVLRRWRRFGVGLRRTRPGRHRRRRRARRVPHHPREPVDRGWEARAINCSREARPVCASKPRAGTARSRSTAPGQIEEVTLDHAARQARPGADAGLPRRLRGRSWRSCSRAGCATTTATA